jgi:hypothetical protein
MPIILHLKLVLLAFGFSKPLQNPFTAELAQCVNELGHPNDADNVRNTLTTLDQNLEHITRGIAELMND